MTPSTCPARAAGSAAGSEGGSLGWSARPMIVIVPGLGMSRRYSTRLHRILAEGHDVVSLDLPGFGGVPAGGRPITMRSLTDAVVAAVAGLPDVVLVGHSMGAQIAVEAALRLDSRGAGLPGANLAGADLPETAVRGLALLSPVVRPDLRSLRSQAARLALDLTREPLGSTAVVTGDFFRTGPARFLAGARTMVGHRIEAALPRLGCPSIVVRGDRDPLNSREWCDRLAALLPQGTAFELAGAHIVQRSAPHRVADLVSDLVAASSIRAVG